MKAPDFRLFTHNESLETPELSELPPDLNLPSSARHNRKTQVLPKLVLPEKTK